MGKKLLRLALCLGTLTAALTCQAFAADYTANDAGTVTYDSENVRYAASYDQAVANEEYALLVVEGTKTEEGSYEYSVTSDSILYIDQAAADANGNISFSFIPKKASNSVVLLGGQFADGSSPKVLGMVLGVEKKLPAPEITVTTSASSGKPYIKWDAVDGATGYEVWRCGTKSGEYTLMYTAKATKLNVTHTGAVVGNDYFYKVRAINGSTAGEFSEIKGVWCDLARPTVKVTNRASDGKPYISWNAVEGATGYKVYRCGTSGGTYSLMYTASATKLNVTHTGAVAGNDYFYKVVAVYGDNTKCNSAMSTAKGVWCDLKRPTVKVTNRASDGKPYITWNAVDGATGYKVYRCDTSTGTYKLMYTAAATKLNVTHTGAVAGNDYFYKVQAIHSNSKCNSALSTYKGVWCDLARPTLTVTLNSKGKPYISWTEVSGADSYKLYRSTDGESYTLMYTAAADDFDVNHTGAVSGTTYYYKVMAVCDATAKANSAYSTVKSITVK